MFTYFPYSFLDVNNIKLYYFYISVNINFKLHLYDILFKIYFQSNSTIHLVTVTIYSFFMDVVSNIYIYN